MTELLRSILLVYAAVLLVTFSFGWSRQLSSTTVSINSWYYAWQFAQEVNFHAPAQ